MSCWASGRVPARSRRPRRLGWRRLDRLFSRRRRASGALFRGAWRGGLLELWQSFLDPRRADQHARLHRLVESFRAAAFAAAVVRARGPCRDFSRAAASDARRMGRAAFLAYVATIVGFGLWSHLLSRHPAAEVTPFALLVPVLGLAAAALVYQSRCAAGSWPGYIFVAMGTGDCGAQRPRQVKNDLARGSRLRYTLPCEGRPDRASCAPVLRDLPIDFTLSRCQRSNS